MERYNNIAIIVPSLNPDEKLRTTVIDLNEAGFDSIIVVNDGSDAEFLHYFDELEKLDFCKRLDHAVNMGKGAALRTAFEYVKENRPDIIGVVTVDSDGQHSVPDVIKCAETLLSYSAPECTEKSPLILGVRDFSLSGIPPRSVFGNRMTSFLFKILFGLKISDTQTGLRAVSTEYIPYLLKISGNRYEYETNMLLETKTYDIPIKEIPIQTVYIDNNSGSHFHPIRDSVRIYGLILKFLLSSVLSFVVDILLFSVSLAILKNIPSPDTKYTVMIATVFSRIISSLVNFFTNKKLVFSLQKSKHHALLRYYALCIPQMFVSGIIVSILTKLIGNGTFLATFIKIIVDTVLFLINFRIQREWVFSQKDKRHK